MTRPLPIEVTRRAAREIAKACEWWDANRPAAPGALQREIARVFRLIALQPGVGAQAKNARLPGVRRVHLSFAVHRERPCARGSAPPRSAVGKNSLAY